MTDEQFLKMFEIQLGTMQVQQSMLELLWAMLADKTDFADSLTELRATVTDLKRTVNQLTVTKQDLDAAVKAATDAMQAIANETDQLAVREANNVQTLTNVIAQLRAQVADQPELQSAVDALAGVASSGLQINARLRQLGTVPTDPVPGGVVPADQPLPTQTPGDLSHLDPAQQQNPTQDGGTSTSSNTPPAGVPGGPLNADPTSTPPAGVPGGPTNPPQFG